MSWAIVRRWGFRIVLVGLLGLGVAALPRLLARPPLAVKTVLVERGTVRDVVTSSTAGEIVPARRAVVRAEMAGRVVAVKHADGDRVKQGELIIALDAADLEARLAQAHATQEGAAAQADQAIARVTTLSRQAERARSLAEQGAGTAQISEDAANLLTEAREGMRAQSRGLAQAEATVRLAAVTRAKARLEAPFDGLLVEVHPDPGEALLPGAPAFEIIDDRRLHVDAAVDEADSARVKVGHPAELTLDALPGRRIPAVVSRVAPAVRRDLKGARVLPIEVEVADVKAAAALGLKPGMSANVEIVVAEKRDVVSLPTHVIIGRGVKRTVFRVASAPGPGNQPLLTAESVAIEVGLANWERTEVQSGVAVGDRIVSNLNAKELADGVKIKVEP